MRRAAAIVLSLALLAAGVYGAWAYAHDYYLYRGFGPPRDPAGVAPGKLVNVRFHSKALGGIHGYKAFLPAGYAASAARGVRFPVFYLLHGAPGSPQLMINAGAAGVAIDTLVARHTVRPMILVAPNGHDGTFRSDTEWANTPHGLYESYLLETVHNVDKHFATIPNRRYRAIAGLSEGAYAAINLALRHLSVFSVAEAWSGYFLQVHTGPFKTATTAQLRANSPALYVPSMREKLRKHPLWAFIYTGHHDRERLKTLAFGAELKAAGGHVLVRIPPGGHDWRLWRDQMQASVRYAAAHVGRR
jgi:S-formylglutathione hydrolase FrmB